MASLKPTIGRVGGEIDGIEKAMYSSIYTTDVSKDQYGS